MLEKEKLRKADVFSGAVVSIFGLWVVSQALKMPMKDSWGGVMNVWYVSPALLPLSIGIIIFLLGLMLCRIAVKTIGSGEFWNSLHWLMGRPMLRFIAVDTTVRFYAMAALFLTLVFVNLPRIDFFLDAVLFLFAFITMFYFNDDALMKRFLCFYLAGEAVFIIYFMLGFDGLLQGILRYATDMLATCFLLGYIWYAWIVVRKHAALRKRYRLALIVSLLAPFLIGSIFKYFLLVPMPKEGLVVAVLDYFWYLEFL